MRRRRLVASVWKTLAYAEVGRWQTKSLASRLLIILMRC